MGRKESNQIKKSNSLDPDQDRQNIRPDRDSQDRQNVRPDMDP